MIGKKEFCHVTAKPTIEVEGKEYHYLDLDIFFDGVSLDDLPHRMYAFDLEKQTASFYQTKDGLCVLHDAHGEGGFCTSKVIGEMDFLGQKVSLHVLVPRDLQPVEFTAKGVITVVPKESRTA